jgi:ankyrin repeat protein
MEPIDALSTTIDELDDLLKKEKQITNELRANKMGVNGEMLEKIQAYIYEKKDELDSIIDSLDITTDQVDTLQGETPLIILSRYGDIECITRLIQRGYDIHSEINRTTPQRVTALMMASAFGRLDVVNTLLMYKPDMNITDTQERSALAYAALRNHQKIALVLIDHGAELNSNMYSSPLYNAVLKNHYTMVVLLVKKGAVFKEILEILRDGVLHRPDILEYLESQVPIRTPEKSKSKKRRIGGYTKRRHTKRVVNKKLT